LEVLTFEQLATVEVAVNELKNRIYLLEYGVFRSHGFEIHVEEEGEHSKQDANEITICRNSRLPLNRDGLRIFSK
jgi:hypothetical protein